MSSKREKKRKRKESRDLAVRLAKAAAREHIGTPPPTRVKSSRKGGKRRGNKELQGVERQEFLNIYEPPEEIPERYISSLRLRPYVATQTKSYRNIMSNVPVISYSKEMIVHANYLRESKGEKIMADELNKNAVMGPIETALKDAEEKARYYTQQVSVAQTESQRWTQIAQGLRQTLGLVTGTPAKSNGSGNTATREGGGRWKKLIISALTSEKRPFTRLELRELGARTYPEKEKNTVDVGINANLKKLINTGVILEIDDKLHLATWTEPEQPEQQQEDQTAA